MRFGRVLSLVSLGAALALPACGSASHLTLFVGSGHVTASQGGTVRSSDGNVTVTIARNALWRDTTVSVEALPRTRWPTDVVQSNPLEVYRLSPEGLRFAHPAAVAIRLRPADLGTAGTDRLPTALFALRAANGVATLDDQTTDVDAGQGTVMLRGTVAHFSSLIVAKGDFEMSMTPRSVTAMEGEAWTATVKLFNAGALTQELTGEAYSWASLPVGAAPEFDERFPSSPQGTEAAPLAIAPAPRSVFLLPTEVMTFHPPYLCKYVGQGTYDFTFKQVSTVTEELKGRYTYLQPDKVVSSTTFTWNLHVYGPATCTKPPANATGNVTTTTSPVSAGGGAGAGEQGATPSGGGGSAAATTTSPSTTAHETSTTTTSTTSTTTAKPSYSVAVQGGCRASGGHLLIAYGVSTSPDQPGASYTAQITGSPQAQGNAQQSGTLDRNGKAQGSWLAQQSSGNYTVTVTVTSGGLTRQGIAGVTCS